MKSFQRQENLWSKQKYIVGAKKNADGSWDYSKAASFLNSSSELLDKTKASLEKNLSQNILSEKEVKNLCRMLHVETEFWKNIKLRQIAKQKSVNPEQILQEVRIYVKSVVRENEKWQLRHYHSTSMEKFQIIAQMRRLLSRSKLKKLKPDIDIPKWSASDDVMMTRDKYNSEGKLMTPGFRENESVGASGSDILLVLRDSIMEKKDYDVTSMYPTISDLKLNDYCEVILVESNQDYQKLQKILSKNKLNIAISLKNTWKRSV